MFNNPFESFHDTVAEAKEEREQLDRLLIISTPRDRVLAALVFVVLIGFAGWLVFGSVAQRITVEGVVVGSIEEQLERSDVVQVLVWSDGGGTAEVKTGMAALVQLSGSSNGLGVIRGQIDAKIDVGLSPEPAAGDSAGRFLQRLDVVADAQDEIMYSSLVGEQCMIVVEVGRQSPLALIGAGLL